MESLVRFATNHLDAGLEISHVRSLCVQQLVHYEPENIERTVQHKLEKSKRQSFTISLRTFVEPRLMNLTIFSTSLV